MPTTPRRSISQVASSARATTTGLLQIVGEELDLEMSQLKAVRLDTTSRRIRARPPRARRSIAADRSCARRRPKRGRRSCSARRCGSVCRWASLAVSKGHRLCRRRGRRPLGQVWRSPRRQAFNVKFTGTGAAEAGQPLMRWSARACRASIFPTRCRQVRACASSARAQHAAWPRGAAARQRAFAPAPGRSASMKARSKDIKRAICAQG